VDSSLHFLTERQRPGMERSEITCTALFGKLVFNLAKELRIYQLDTIEHLRLERDTPRDLMKNL